MPQVKYSRLTVKEQKYMQEIDFLKGKLIITFRMNGYSLYIRYNDFEEYSYQFMYSKKENDRFRYDNYDDRWNIKTRPHHFHARGLKNGMESSMNGEPSHDIPILLKYIEEKVKF